MTRTFTLVVCVLGAGASPADEADLKPLAGTWALKASTLGGRDHNEDFKGMILKIEGNNYVVGFDTVGDKGTLTVGTAKDHKTIDLKTKPDGLFKGRTMPGIYKIDGDTLTICVNTEKPDRPTKYEAPEKTPLMLLTFVREKK